MRIAEAENAIRLECMSIDRSSHELLGHFDRPKLVLSPDFDWDETDFGAAEFDPHAVESKFADDLLEARCSRTQSLATETDAKVERPAAPIGVWPVLQWAAAVVVFAAAAGVLLDLCHGIAADRALRSAARAGATEATLPKATNESVTATIERRLAAYPQLMKRAHVTLLQNGFPVGERFVARGGDRISVTISVPASLLNSSWWGKLTSWRDEPPAIVHAESLVPGRKMRMRRS